MLMALRDYSSVFLLFAFLATLLPLESQAESLLDSTRSPLAVTRVVMRDVESFAAIVKSNHRRLRKERNIDKQCMQDAVETEQQWFVYCKDIFDDVAASRLVSNKTLEDFCAKNCSGHIWDLAQRLARDCGYSPQKGLVGYDEVLKQACNDDGHGMLCVLDWANVNYTAITGYVSCSKAQANSQVCPVDCKTAIPLVSKLYGCCYSALQRSPNNYIKYIISEQTFQKCGYKEPPGCHAPSGSDAENTSS